ncbi:MAG: hypothetical protein JWQ09_5854 [Segetibacter sp.]|nr:hypothetical protein [Segetibacter sp.]
MKDTLTKENFWDEMEQKYPKAMKHFKKWIDQYKTEHDWDYLFNGNITHGVGFFTVKEQTTESPKYHELPIAMQFGIFCEWLSSTSDTFACPIDNPRRTISFQLDKRENLLSNNKPPPKQ